MYSLFTQISYSNLVTCFFSIQMMQFQMLLIKKEKKKKILYTCLWKNYRQYCQIAVQYSYNTHYGLRDYNVFFFFKESFDRYRCCPTLVKLGNNETNNSCPEASHVLRNSLARVQMALVASRSLMLIYNVQPHVEHQISNSNKSHMGRACLDCGHGTLENDPYNSLMNNRHVGITNTVSFHS